jgi:uncharacterized protein YdhG (YjbR/CyaY superfamily)
MKRGSTTVNEVEVYLSKVPESALGALLRVREAIRSAAPEWATEEMGYGVPAFRAPEPGGALLAGYAAGRKFCSYYPMSGRVIHKLSEELKGYETTSGSIHFPLDKPLPVALVRKLVRARLAEIQKGI